MAGSSAAVKDAEDIRRNSTSSIYDGTSVDPPSDKEVININTLDRTKTCNKPNAFHDPVGNNINVSCGKSEWSDPSKCKYIWSGPSKKSLMSEIDYLDKTVTSLRSEKYLQSQEHKKSIEELESDKRTLQVEIHDAKNKNAMLESRIESLNRQLEGLNKQNAITKTRTQDLEDELEKVKRQHMDDTNSRMNVLPKTERNEEEINEMHVKQKKLTSHNTSLQNEIHKLKKQIESLECKWQDQNKETEEVRRRERENVDRVRTLKQDVERHRKANEKLTLDSKDWQRQREDMQRRNIELEERINGMAKKILELNNQVFAQQESSSTRETSLTESHQQHMTQLREQHKSDLEEKERRYAAEKEQQQSQLEVFLRNVNDDNRLERDTLRTAMQQMTETNMAINRILNAAFQAYQERRYGRGATVREIKDDF